MARSKPRRSHRDLGFTVEEHLAELPDHRGAVRGFLRDARRMARERKCDTALDYLTIGASWIGAASAHVKSSGIPGRVPPASEATKIVLGMSRSLAGARRAVAKACFKPRKAR